MRRVLCLLILSGFAILLFVACGKDEPDDKSDETTPTISEEANVNEAKTYVCTKENVKLLGRTYLLEDVCWLSLSAAGVEFNFTGTKCDIDFLADDTYGTSAKRARVAIFVNGTLFTDFLMDELNKTINVIDETKETTAVIRVVKLSEVSDSTIGIASVTALGSVTPTDEKELKIEFVGDSITCGYGVDGVFEVDTYSTTTENATKTYAYKTAELLNADYSMFCMSGHGIISGYTGDGTIRDDQTVPPYYTTMGKGWGKFNQKTLPQKVEWDFAGFTPDYVVVNLGTNDDSYCGNDEERWLVYESAYLEFLKQLREKNPNATIICTIGIMGDRPYKYIEEMLEQYIQETGDTNITSMKFDVQNQSVDGVVVDWHPSEATHTKAAEKLAAFITELEEAK